MNLQANYAVSQQRSILSLWYIHYLSVHVYKGTYVREYLTACACQCLFSSLLPREEFAAPRECGTAAKTMNLRIFLIVPYTRCRGTPKIAFEPVGETLNISWETTFSGLQSQTDKNTLFYSLLLCQKKFISLLIFHKFPTFFQHYYNVSFKILERNKI